MENLKIKFSQIYRSIVEVTKAAADGDIFTPTFN